MSGVLVDVVALAPRRSYITLMLLPPTPLERAFALARTGEYASVAEIRIQLHAEGYETNQLMGPTLFKQLRSLCDAARPAPEA